MTKQKTRIERAKRKLWAFGYSVKDYSDAPDSKWDLLVEGKRVKVGIKQPKNIDGYDVFALTIEGSPIKFFIKADTSGMAEVLTASGVFGKKVEKKS